ncbi:MAG: glycosyltransferase family 1 protein [Frankiales bacterium]|nr:glycosyltransferase family 1 protein [Frankiales bacterium]
MRVLHVNDHPPGHGYGGAEVNLARLIAAQRTLGDDVETLTPEASRTGVRRTLDLWDPGARRRLLEVVARFRPDVVHLHNVVRELSPAVLRPTGVPTVMTVHDMRLVGGSEHHLPDPRAVAARLWVDPVVRRLAQRLAMVLGVSDVVAEALRETGLRRVRTLPVPVPAPTLAPHPVEECHDIVFAGTLAPDKGARVLRDAFLAVADRHPAARLVLVGDGPERRRLEVDADARVLLPGRLAGAEVSRAMGGARVVVVPSLPALRREGSSITAVEGARHARPLVVSDDPAVAEVARRVGGDVVPAGDVAALAARLDYWLGSPAAARAAGDHAATLAADYYDPATVASQLSEVYRDCLRASRRSAQ